MAKSVLWVALQELKVQFQTICEAAIQKITSIVVILSTRWGNQNHSADLVILVRTGNLPLRADTLTALAGSNCGSERDHRRRRRAKQFALLSMLLSTANSLAYYERDKIMNLAQLHYFRKLAQLEHYTQAAQELFISQPSLNVPFRPWRRSCTLSCFRKKGRRKLN